MQTQNLRYFKPQDSRSGKFKSIEIAAYLDYYVAVAHHVNGISLPMKRGSLAEVIPEVEHAAAHFGVPVTHDLSKPITLIVEHYRNMGDDLVWHRRDSLIFHNADEAYLALRQTANTVDNDALIVFSGDETKFLRCSQNCIKEFATVIYRLMYNGALPANARKLTDKCPRCFSRFINESMCLECGYEQ